MNYFPRRTEEGLRVVRDAFRRLAASWFLLPLALAIFVCALVWVVYPEPEETSPRLSAQERFKRGMRAYHDSLALLGTASRSARTELMKSALLHLRMLEAQYGVPAGMWKAHKAMGDTHLAFASEGEAAPGGREWNLREAERQYAMFLELAREEEPRREAASSRVEALVELGEYGRAFSILEDLLRDIEHAQVEALLEERRTGVQLALGPETAGSEIAAKARLLAGRTLVGLGREDEAQAELERFLASGGGTHEERSRGVLLLARMLLLRRSSLDRARELFRDSPGPEARLGLARIEFALGNHARALEILSRRPRLPGEWGRAADFLAALCLFEEGEYGKAGHAFSRLTAIGPASPEGVASVVGLAEAALEARYFAKAGEELKRACDLIPPPAYDAVELPERDERLTRAYVRGLVVKLAGRLERAAQYEDSHDALRLAHEKLGLASEDFARAGARVLAKKGTPRDLVRSARLLLRLGDADSVVLASERFREAGDPAGAAHACGVFARLFPQDARVSRMRHERGIALRELGLFRRACDVFRQNSPRASERARDPYAYESTIELARTHAMRAHFEPAREEELLLAAGAAYREIIRDPRFATDSLIFAKVRFELAGVEARLGLESAEDFLTAALENSPSREARPLLWEYSRRRAPGVCMEVGHLFRKRGDSARAAGWYAKARELGGGAEAALFEALAVRALEGPGERPRELLRVAREEARLAGDDGLAAVAAELAQKAKAGRPVLSILDIAAGPGGNAEEIGEKGR